MRQPLWKILLSYIKEVPIEETGSIYNDSVEVLLSKGEYQLTTPDAIYSYGKRYDNFYEAFTQMDLERIRGEEVLLLGLGLGSIPLMLEKYFHRRYSYTAVEIDESIIHLASKYVLDELESPMTTVCTDALHYVTYCAAEFDMIAMDIFVSTHIPEEFETIDYLENLKDLLSPDGTLLFNRLYYYEADQRRTEQYYEEVFLKVFPSGARLDINGNWILISDRSLLR